MEQEYERTDGGDGDIMVSPRPLQRRRHLPTSVAWGERDLRRLRPGLDASVPGTHANILGCGRAAAPPALLLLAAAATVGVQAQDIECRIETGTCYEGPNLAVDLGSGISGCVELPQLQDCCELCSQRWPECKSFQYITSNAYPGVPKFFCCLKGSFRPQVSTTQFGCDSGYQGPSCFITQTCEANVFGQSLSITDEVLVRPAGQSCTSDPADLDAAFWPGITNPASVTNDGAFKTYAMGLSPAGTIGSHRICHRSDPAAAFETTVGEFTMRGPYQNQSHTCTLGSDCEVTILGLDLKLTNAQYRLAIVSNPPCGAGATFASFVALENPDGVEQAGNYDTFKMGRPMKGNTLDPFTLCWAAALSNSDFNSPAAYTQPAGVFMMYGPVATSHNCTMGAPCSVQVTGRGLAATNGVMVIQGNTNNLCGLRVAVNPIFGFTNPTNIDPAPPYTDYSFGTPYSMGTPSFFKHGHDYRLCWASMRDEAPPTGMFTNFLVDVGGFTLIGPEAANYECWLTYTCDLQLVGTGLDMTDGVLIIKQVLGFDGVCGQTSSPVLMEVSGLTWTNPGPMGSAADTAAVVPLGIASAATDGIVGVPHNLCWAGEAVDYTSYKLTVGTFMIHGPIPEDNTCYKALECIITLGGSGFRATNEIAIMRSAADCGNPNASIADFIPTGTFGVSVVQHVQPGLFNEYRLGFPILGTARADYVLCWSHQPTISSPPWTAESTYEDFSFQDYSFVVGTLQIGGANDQPMYCTLSLPCTLVLSGALLASTNRIIVITSEQECGAAAPPYAVFEDSLTRADRHYNLGPIGPPWNSYDLETPASGTPATNYRICWAHNPANTVDPSLYRAPIGFLTVYGPDSPMVPDVHQCTMSLFCTLRLTGIGLQSTNSIQIVKKPKACLTAHGPDVANLAGIANPQGPVAGDPYHYDLGWLGSGLPGDNYWLCWAHDPVITEDFRTTLASFTLLGPHVMTGPGVQECTLGRECEITVSGEGLAPGNKILVVSTSDDCAGRQFVLDRAVFVGSPNPAVNEAGDIGKFSLAVPTSTKLPGTYKICWSYGGVQNEDFVREVGSLLMGGPLMQFTECTLSEPCRIVLTGNSFSSFSQVLILRKSVDGGTWCGDGAGTSPAAIIPEWAGIENPKRSSNVRTPAPTPGFLFDTYDLGVGYAALTASAKPGRGFLLCWAYNPPGGDGAAAYKVPIGDFSMNGADEGFAPSCVLGLQCNIAITGYGLAPQNQIRIMTYDCDTGSPAVLAGVQNPQTVIDDAYDNRYSMGLVTVGGSYAACNRAIKASTCIGSHYRLCWAHGDTPNYIVDVGSFAMSGPFVNYQVECFIGAVCAFKIYGSRLAVSNRLLIIEGFSTCGEETPLVMALPGLRNPQRVSTVSVDGTEATVRLGTGSGGDASRARLCWGYDPIHLREYNIEIGPFAFGPPPELCEVQDGLLVSCSLPPSDP